MTPGCRGEWESDYSYKLKGFILVGITLPCGKIEYFNYLDEMEMTITVVNKRTVDNFGLKFIFFKELTTHIGTYELCNQRNK